MEKNLKIALIGYGKMGRMVEKSAKKAGHTISSIIDPTHFGNRIEALSVADADVCIDFTHPSTVMDNIRATTALGKNMVVGTTGWGEHLPEVKRLIEKSGTAFFYAANFSVGVHLFMKIVAHAASLIRETDQYEIAGYEAHHSQKADAPSGTARALAKIIAEQSGAEVPFTSLRCGSIPGTHTVLFDSPEDTITLTHQARNRVGWAKGAIDAAEWLSGRKGVFTMDDLILSGEKLCQR